MVLRTELNIPSAPFNIRHDEGILLIGSCFSNNIGSQLQKYKFNSITNPFGTIFNPVSISKLIEYASKETVITTSDLLESQARYVHPDFHSAFSNSNPEHTVNEINEAIRTTKKFLIKAKHIFITLGSSIVYRQQKSGNVVANCHKLPSTMFFKHHLSLDEGEVAMSTMIDNLKMMNPGLSITFTVSPVRHIKDGIIENSRSKARLIQLIDNAIVNYNDVHYFPAYEFMMDDLRDYRFYDDDLIHPNQMAIKYIWEKFCGHFLDSETMELIKKIDQILQGLSHRPFNPESESHKIFQHNLNQQISDLRSKHPFLEF